MICWKIYCQGLWRVSHICIIPDTVNKLRWAIQGNLVLLCGQGNNSIKWCLTIGSYKSGYLIWNLLNEFKGVLYEITMVLDSVYNVTIFTFNQDNYFVRKHNIEMMDFAMTLHLQGKVILYVWSYHLLWHDIWASRGESLSLGFERV